jgi:hypothetical protein
VIMAARDSQPLGVLLVGIVAGGSVIGVVGASVGADATVVAVAAAAIGVSVGSGAFAVVGAHAVRRIASSTMILAGRAIGFFFLLAG